MKTVKQKKAEAMKLTLETIEALKPHVEKHHSLNVEVQKTVNKAFATHLATKGETEIRSLLDGAVLFARFPTAVNIIRVILEGMQRAKQDGTPLTEDHHLCHKFVQLVEEGCAIAKEQANVLRDAAKFPSLSSVVPPEIQARLGQVRSLHDVGVEEVATVLFNVVPDRSFQESFIKDIKEGGLWDTLLSVEHVERTVGKFQVPPGTVFKATSIALTKYVEAGGDIDTERLQKVLDILKQATTPH